METFLQRLLSVYHALIPILGAAWILNIFQRLGFPVVAVEGVSTLLGIAIAAAFVKFPYREKAGLLELVLGILALAAWLWSAAHYEAWIVGMADRTLDKWVPGVIAIVLMMEAMRKACGLPITVLVWIFFAYAMLGQGLPGALQAEPHAATKIILFSYADSNGIPGLVLTVVCTVVLAFIILGRLMEVSGATTFFTDVAMGLMGHRRGGPAKVAVVASSAFGMVSGSIVGNIMSTGIVTIPLMKRFGFKPHFAAAIEAVASNGGQIAPPIMGATAFLIAEFLQISYAEVVLAAAIPAALYYLVLFLQVDAIAARYKLSGLPRSDLPRVGPVLAKGWVYLIPIAIMIYFLFWLGFNPALSALYAVGALLVLMIVRNRRLLTIEQWKEFIVGSGANMVTLILIGGGAGAVIGILNSSGLGFQLTLILADVTAAAGLLAMLVVTAAISIILGMGMPTAAVYLVLSIVLAPALGEIGVVPIAAHLFLFYFGLLSMLTPPVAVASYVAAGVAGSNMWKTGLAGVQFAAAAYLLPFLWIYNPALLGIGTWYDIILVVASATVAGFLLARGMLDFRHENARTRLLGLVEFALVLLVGGSTVFFGSESTIALLITCAGALIVAYSYRPKGLREVEADRTRP
jgi:TRAP transporter 4TM/12TM fusion protein